MSDSSPDSARARLVAAWRRWLAGDGDGLLATGPEIERHWVASAALLVMVVVAAAAFARFFRDSSLLFLELLTGTQEPTEAAESLPRIVVASIVLAAVLLAAVIGTWAQRRWPDRLGVHAVAATARGEDRSISGRATTARSVATWIIAGTMVSIGRESAIIETGGAIGSSAGRRFRGRGAALAAAGIASAFAAAYHAPIAAMIYVDEHLRVRLRRRIAGYALVGAVGGHVVAVGLLDGHPIFPGPTGDRVDMLGMGLLVVVPAAIASRVFLEARTRIDARPVATWSTRRWWRSAILFGLVAAIAVAVAPTIAGNGMEALRHAAVETTVGVAASFAVIKLIATVATLGTGAPGGVLTPALSVAAGWGALTILGAQALGVETGPVWDGMLVAMAVGLAVGLRSPFLAVVMIAEMTGQIGLTWVFACIVPLAWLADRGIDRLLLARGERLPVGVHDEDA